MDTRISTFIREYVQRSSEELINVISIVSIEKYKFTHDSLVASFHGFPWQISWESELYVQPFSIIAV